MENPILSKLKLLDNVMQGRVPVREEDPPRLRAKRRTRLHLLPRQGEPIHRSDLFWVLCDGGLIGGAGFTCASTRRDPGPQGRWPCLGTSSGMNATQQRHLNLDALDAADGSMGLKQPLPLLKDDFPGLSPSIGGVAMGASPPASARQPDP